MNSVFGSAFLWPHPRKNPPILLHGAKMGHVAKEEGLACQTSIDYTSVAVYKTWHAVPQGSYSIHSGQNSWLQFTFSGCPHYPMRCTYMYALYSSVGKAKGNTLRAQSILCKVMLTQATPGPTHPDTVTQQHHLVSTQLVLSESFMSAYS